MRNVVLVLAAGMSSRFLGGKSAAADATLKLYSKLGKCSGRSVLSATVGLFYNHRSIDRICVVVNPMHKEHYDKALIDFDNLLLTPGGDTRKKSVLRGLEFLSQYSPKNVLIHDAARPFISHRIIDDVIEALDTHHAVDVLMPVVDTIKTFRDGKLSILPRDSLYQTQTPQGFNFSTIYDLHQKSVDDEYTDDISLCIANDLEVVYVLGETKNYKITFRDDL